MAGILCLLVYPVVMIIFLYRNQKKLEEPAMIVKYSSVYDGIETHSRQAILYSPIFCVRRFLIVLINISFNVNFPWTAFEQNSYLYKILIFVGIQFLYILYIADTKPHTIERFNKLELLNEVLLVILAYVMIAFSGIVEGQSYGNTLAELCAISLTSVIIIANFRIMIQRTIHLLRIAFFRFKTMKRRNAVKLNKQNKNIEMQNSV